MEQQDMKKLLLKGKSARMATEEEVWRVARCRPGGVPPFGILFDGPGGVRTFMDHSLAEQGDVCNFNCGLKTRSMQVSVSDYIAAEAPERVHIVTDD